MTQLVFRPSDFIGLYEEEECEPTPFVIQTLPNLKPIIQFVETIVSGYPIEEYIMDEQIDDYYDQYGIVKKGRFLRKNKNTIELITYEDYLCLIYGGNRFAIFDHVPKEEREVMDMKKRMFQNIYVEGSDRQRLLAVCLVSKFLLPTHNMEQNVDDFFSYCDGSDIFSTSSWETDDDSPPATVQPKQPETKPAPPYYSVEMAQPLQFQMESMSLEMELIQTPLSPPEQLNYYLVEPVQPLQFKMESMLPSAFLPDDVISVTSTIDANEQIIPAPLIVHQPVVEEIPRFDTMSTAVRSIPGESTIHHSNIPSTSSKQEHIFPTVQCTNQLVLDDESTTTDTSEAPRPQVPPPRTVQDWVNDQPSISNTDEISEESLTDKATDFLSTFMSRAEITIPVTLMLAGLVNLAIQLRNVLKHVHPSNPGRWKLLTNTLVTFVLAIVGICYYFKLITDKIPLGRLINFIKLHLSPVTFNDQDFNLIQQLSKKLKKGYPIPTSLQCTNPMHARVARFCSLLPHMPSQDAIKECYILAYNSDEHVDLTPQFRAIIQKFRPQQFNIDSLLSALISVVSFICGALVFLGINAPAQVMKDFRKILKDYNDNRKSLVQIKEDILSLVSPKTELIHKAITLRDQMHRMLANPSCTILSDFSLLSAFNALLKQAEDLEQIILKNHSGNHSFNSFLNMAASLRTRNMELLTLTLSQAGKQVPVSFYFYGAMGIGKTTLILNQFTQDIAEQLGIPATTYDMKPDDGKYFREYAGQPFAYADEMGAVPKETSHVSIINEVIGPTGKEMSGAFIKRQPFCSPFVFLISNMSCYEMIHGVSMHHASQDAFISRFIEIEVKNPKVPLNATRGADVAAFNKENFEFTLKEQLLNGETRQREITYQELVEMAVEKFKEKSAEFKTRLNKIPSFVNQANKMPFIVTLAGESGCGKSYFASETAKLIAEANSSQICEYATFQDTYDTPYVCLHDALNTETLDDQKIFKLESASSKSIIFNTTNIMKQRLSILQCLYCFAGIYNVFLALMDCCQRRICPAWFTPLLKPIFPEVGFYRRLAYYGSYLIEGKMVTIPETGMYIESQPGFQWKYNGTIYSLEEMRSTIIAKYDQYVKGSVFDIIDAEPPTDYNATIWFDTIEGALAYVQEFSILKVQYSATPKQNNITVTDVKSLAGEAINLDTILQFKPTAAQYKTQTFRFLCYLRRQFPKLSIDIRIGTFRLSLHNGVIYGSMKQSTLTVTDLGDDKYHLQDGIAHCDVTKEEIINYIDGISALPTSSKILVKNMITAEMLPLPIAELLNQRMQDNVNQITISRWQVYCVKARDTLSSSLAIKIYLGLLAVIGMGGIIAFFRRKHQEPVEIQKKHRVKKMMKAGVSKSYGKYYRSGDDVIYWGDPKFNEQEFYQARVDDFFEHSDNWDDVVVYNVAHEIEEMEARGFKDARGRRQYQSVPVEKKLQSNIRPVIMKDKKSRAADIVVDADYFLRLKTAFEDKKLLHIVVPNFVNISGIKVNIKNRTNNASFCFGKCTVSTCNLNTVIELDGDAEHFGFTTFPEMITEPALQNSSATYTVLSREFASTKVYPVITQQQLERIEEENYFLSPVTTERTNGVKIYETNEMFYMTYRLVNEFPDKELTPFLKWKKNEVSCYAVEAFKPQMIQYVPAAETKMSRFKRLYQQQACIVRTDSFMVTGLFLSDTEVITVKHVFSDGFQGAAVELWKEEQSIEYEVSKHFTVECSAKYDIAVLRFAKPVAGMKSLHKHFDTDFPTTRAVTLTVLGNCHQSDLTVQAVVERQTKVSRANNYSCAKLIKARIPSPELATVSGDCGRPYVYYDPINDAFKILALHSGADQNHIYGALIDRKLFSGFSYQANLPSTSFRPIGHRQTRYSNVCEGENIEIVGTITPSTSPSEPYSQPSPLAKFFSTITPNVKGPAKNQVEQLTPSELAQLGTDAFGNKDFYVNQISYYNDVVLPFDRNHTKEFADGLAEELFAQFAGLEPMHILSDTEVLNGIRDRRDPLWTVANCMNWNGAVGVEVKNRYPGTHVKDDVVESPTGSRIDMQFRDSPAANYIKNKFEKHVSDAWEGKSNYSLLQDNLKQENRVEEKRWKARVFTAFPMDLSMFERKFLLRFLSSITRKHSALPYKIGIDTATEFNIELIKARAFASKGMCFGFDLSRCDKHMLEQFFRDVLEVALRRMIIKQHLATGCNCEHELAEHLAAIHVAVGHLYYNLVASQDVVYLKKRGNSSGSDATAPLNSIYLDYLLFCYYKSVMNHLKLQTTFRIYRSDLLSMFYGDDGKVVVRDDLIENFGFLGFQSFLKSYGIEIDVPTKDGKAYWLLPFEDVPFISREWTQLPSGYWTHRFKEEILSGLIYWTTQLEESHLFSQVQLIGEICLTYGCERYEYFRLLLGKFIQEYPLAYEMLDFPPYHIAARSLVGNILGPPQFQRILSTDISNQSITPQSKSIQI